MNIRNGCGAGLLALTMSLAAHADTVAVVGAASPAGKLSAEQVAAVFTMRLKALPGTTGAQLVVVESSKPQMLAAMGKTEDQARAIWARQVFTGGGTPPIEVGSVADARKLLSNPNAIAVIDSSAVDASMKVLASF
jgi:hypothetical protein